MSKLIKEEVLCPRCKGKGRIFDTAECVFTGGISLILGILDSNLKDVCPKCNGKGIIYRKIIIEKK